MLIQPNVLIVSIVMVSQPARGGGGGQGEGEGRGEGEGGGGEGGGKREGDEGVREGGGKGRRMRLYVVIQSQQKPILIVTAHGTLN